MSGVMTVELPGGTPRVDAEFTRHGSDLQISGDNEPVVIEGYFADVFPPDLLTPDGARLTPDFIQSFLRSGHAGEYASADSWTVTDESAVAQVESIRGEAWVIRADGTRHELEEGFPVFEGDVIETSADGALSLLFADRTHFAVSENARLSIDEFIYDVGEGEGSSFFSMLRGVFVYTSGLIGKDDPGNVNIETPVGSIGIRGTVVAGRISPAGEDSKITIIDGAVVITNAAGSFELDAKLETIQFSSYTEPAVELGQVDAAALKSDYGPLADVAPDTYHAIVPRDAGSDHRDGEGSDRPDTTGTDAPAPDGREGSSDARESGETRTAEAPHAETVLPDILARDLALAPEVGDAPAPDASDPAQGPVVPPVQQPPAPPSTGDGSTDNATDTTSGAPENFDPVFHPVNAGDLATSLYFGTGEKITNVNGDPIRIAAADANVNQTLTYSIVGGNAFFDIDSRTGEILAAQTLDWTTVQGMGAQTLQIEARDPLGAADLVTIQLDLSANPFSGNGPVGFGDENGSVASVASLSSLFAFGGDDVLSLGTGPGTSQQYVWGGTGQDTFIVYNTLFNLIDGGDGFDTLSLQASTADFTASNKIKSIERIATNGNMVTLNYADLVEMTDADNRLVIDGGGSADLQLNGHSSFVELKDGVGSNGQGQGSYSLYTDGTASLIVHDSVNLNIVP